MQPLTKFLFGQLSKWFCCHLLTLPMNVGWAWRTASTTKRCTPPKRSATAVRPSTGTTAMCIPRSTFSLIQSLRKWDWISKWVPKIKFWSKAIWLGKLLLKGPKLKWKEDRLSFLVLQNRKLESYLERPPFHTHSFFKSIFLPFRIVTHIRETVCTIIMETECPALHSDSGPWAISPNVAELDCTAPTRWA